MGSSSFLKALAKEKEDKGVDERGARTTSGNESLHYRKAANKSKAGDSSASASASSSGKYYSQGQKAEVIGNTGLRKAATITKTDSKKLSGSDKGVLQKWKEQREQAVRSQEDAKKKGQNAIEALMTASKKQTEEQNKKKSASFTAGLLDSMGGNAAKILTKGVEKAGGTTAGIDYMKAQLNALEETKNANKGYGTAGAIVGEFAKAGAGYATVGKAAEQAALKAAAKVSGGKALGKAGTIATKLAAQQAADTAVNTPITIAAGLAEGKDRKEILKDIGKQEATDAAFNVGLEALGAGAKVAGKTIGNAVEKAKNAKQNKAVIEESRQAAKTELLEAAVKPEKETAAQARKKILEEADLPELAKEYQLMNSDDFWTAKTKEIMEKYGDDTAAATAEYAKLENRKQELEEMLGIRTGKVKETEKKIYREVVGNVKKLLSISGKENNAETQEIIRKAIAEAKTGSISKETRNDIFEKLFNIGKINNKEEIDQGVKAYLKGAKFKISAEDAANIADFDAFRKKGFGKIGGVSIAKEGNIDINWQEMNELWPDLFPAEITHPAEQLERIFAVADGMTYREIPLAETIDEATKAGMRQEFDTYMDGIETGMQKLSRYTDRRAERQVQRLLKEERQPSYSEVGNNTLQPEAASASAKLMSKEVREKMLQEYNMLIDPEYVGDYIAEYYHPMITDSETLQKVYKRIDMRRTALEEMLGIKTKKEKEAEKRLRNEAVKEMKELFSISGKELTEETRELIGLAMPEMKSGMLTARTREMIFNDLFDISTVSEEAATELRKTFDTQMDKLSDEVYKLAVYGTDRTEKQRRRLISEGVFEDYSSLTDYDISELYKQKYDLEKEVQRLRRTRLLTSGDEIALKKLLNGEIDEPTARKLAGVHKNDLIDIYDAEKPLSNIKKTIQGYTEHNKEKMRKTISDAVGEIKIGKDGWNDKKLAMAYGRETAERNILDIAPKETANKIIDTIYRPIHDNERKRVLMVNDYVGRVGKTNVSTKKSIECPYLFGVSDESGKASESALVQWLGEKRYRVKEIEAMKEAPSPEVLNEYNELKEGISYAEGCLKPEERERIDACIEELQKIYKELHPEINKIRIRNGYEPIGYIEGYFPHMNFDEPDGIMETTAAKLGFDFSSKELPMDIAGRTKDFRPGTKYSGNTLERKGTETDYDALRAFDIYISNMSDIIHHTDDIQRLRTYEEYIRYELSDEGIKRKIQEVWDSKELSYAEKEVETQEIYAATGGDHKLQNYINHITEYTNLLAGKKSSLDRAMEEGVVGRKFYKAINEIENRVAGNMVAGNVGSALTNFIPITQALGSMKTTNSMRGLKEALVYMGREEMDELTRKSAFLATRGGEKKLYKNWLENLQEAGGKANPLQWMEVVDTFCTQAVWRGKYYDDLGKGITEDAAVQNADEFARGLFAGRSKGATPTVISSKALKPLTMFQLEVNNQLSYILKDIPRQEQGDAQKIFKRWFGMAMGAYVFNDVYEKLTGRRSALDPFSIANEAIGDLTGDQVRNTLDILGDAIGGEGVQLTEEVEQEKPSVALENAMEEIGGQVPFVGGLLFDGGRIPVQSAIPNLITAGGAIADMHNAEDEEERAKAKETLLEEAEKPFWYLWMPTAGGQMKKTVEGAITMARGGEFGQTTKGEKLKFTVDQESPKDWAQALLFGKWSTDGGRAYIEDSSSALGTSQTKTYRKLIAEGVKNIDAFEEINKVRVCEKAEDKRSVILNSGLSDNQKATLYYDLVLDSDSKDREVLDHFEGKDSRGEVAKCLMQMAGQITEKGKKSCLQKADLSEGEKVWIYLNKLVTSDNKDKEQSRVLTLQRAGVTINEYLMIRQSYGTLYNSGYNKDAKQQQLIAQMNELGLSQAQQAKVKELFAFGGGYKDAWKY